jgi:hypothetical protein
LVLNNKRKMKKFLLSSMLVILFFVGRTQQLNKQALKYSPGTIAKLYDISKAVSLSDSQQVKLAAEFEMADSLLAISLKQNISRAEIDSAQLNSQVKIAMIMGKDMFPYTLKKASRFASAASNGEIKYLKQEYGLDTSLAAKLRAMQFNKYRGMFQQYLLYGFNETKAQDKIADLAKNFDSLSFTLYPVLHSGKFLENYLAEIKKIKPSVPDSIIGKIQVAFLALTAKNVYIDCGQTMLDIMQHVYPDTLITAHFYKPVIERQAKFLSAAEKNYLIDELQVSKTAFNGIYHLVWQKNYHLALLEYTYGLNAAMADSIINISNRKYDNEIKGALLRDGSLLSTSQFAIALKYKEVLQLRSTLIDTLVLHALYLDNKQDSIKKKDPFAKSDFKAYEAKWLNMLLSEEQYTKLLAIKTASAARMDAEDDWEDMETWNITNGFEKEATIKELYKYYQVKWIAYYRLAHDKLKQEANQRMIKDAQPKALRMLASAKKLPGPVNANTSLQLKW